MKHYRPKSTSKTFISDGETPEIRFACPIVVGFIFGAETLGGLLAGVTVSGVLMAIFQSNAGGAWDNAKKLFEEGVEINGEKYFTLGREEIGDLEWVFDHEFFILLNFALGGQFAGSIGLDTEFPANLYVDYVRVYQAVP